MMTALPLFAAAAAAIMQPAGMSHDHGAMGSEMATGAQPTETGQSAYAAISEIVSILANDPTTDWSKVNIEALRSHLIDMDNVTLRSTQRMEVLPNGARFTVTGAPDVAGSIQRIAAVHFIGDNMPTGWTMNSTRTPDGAIVSVTAPTPGDAAKIRALGFVGLLTLGAHHQPHHLMMAKGLGHH